MKRASLVIALGCCMAVGPALARDIYVDPEHGVDTADGLAAARATPDGAGPVKTLARAVALAQAGDTVNLAPRQQPYHETLDLHSKAGEPGRPIVFDGHGATLTGCDALRPAEWTQAGPGLFRSESLYATLKGQPSVVDRVFFRFDGKMQHMGRTSKGPKAAFKKPEELQPGEWTLVEGPNVFYVRIADGQALADAHIEIPYRLNGVGIHGKGTAHLVIRNLTTTHFLNDGYNIHNESRDLRFENIRAYENGDDGLSAHEACELEVDGFVSIGNSTGVCNINQAACKLDNIYLGGNHGFEFFACEGTSFAISNAIVDASTAATPFVIRGHPKTAQISRVTMDNVLVRYAGTERKRFEVMPNGVLDATRLTSVGLAWYVAGSASVTASVIRGSAEAGLECATGAVWRADRNVYDLARVRVDGRTCSAAAFLAYPQTATGQIVSSRCQALSSNEVQRLSYGPGQVFAGVGANLAAMSVPVVPSGGVPPVDATPLRP